MKSSHVKIGLACTVVALAGALFFNYSASDAHQEPLAVNTSIEQAPLLEALPAPLTENTASTIVPLQLAQYKNQRALRTFYEQKYSDRMLAKLKEGQYNLNKYGHIVVYPDPISAFWDLEDFEKLKNYQADPQKVREVLQYEPLAQKIDSSWQLVDQVLLGNSDQAEVISHFVQGDQQLMIMQKKWNGTEKMFAEYINYKVGENQDIAAIYQTYNDQQLKNITLIHNGFSYKIHTLNFSEQEFNQLLSQIDL